MGKSKQQPSGPVFDLDAARAERLAKAGPPPVVKFGGKSFTLAQERPFALGLELMLIREEPDRARHHIWAALESVLPAEQLHEFTALGPSEADIAAFLAGASDAWEAAAKATAERAAAASADGEA